MSARWDRRLAVAAAAAALLFGAHALFVAVDYRLRDQDSRLYEGISVELAHLPLAAWIAPDWPAGHDRRPFLEHTAVFFWPAALLGRLGVARPALVANLAYHLGTLALLFAVARLLAGPRAAAVATASFAISPLGLMYLVRANHEPLWGLLFLAGLYCALEVPRGARLGPPLALSIALAALVKGALGLLVVPLLVACVVTRPGARRTLPWIGAGVLLAAAAALGYEALYRAAAQRSFFQGYLATQLQAVQAFEGLGIGRKLTNPFYYALNAVWFGLPGVALWIASLRERPAAPSDARRLAARGLATGLACLSLMSRRAMRYLYPAYPLLHLPGAAWLSNKPAVARALARLEPHFPFAVLGAVALLCAARVYFDLHWYRFVNPLQP